MLDEYPKEIVLKDGTLVTLRPLESNDADLLVAFFQGIPALSWVVFAIIWFHGIEFRVFFIMVMTTLPAFTFQILDAFRSMSKDLFEGYGARTVAVVDSDNSSAVENVEKILESLIAEGKADAFFTCGSNRLLKLMQRIGKKHNIPGQVAMEQIMVCGFGACYVCMRTFEVDGKKVLRRVCRDGPVFNMQEAVGW